MKIDREVEIEPEPPRTMTVRGVGGELVSTVARRPSKPNCTPSRRRESEGNWSLGVDPCFAGKIQGDSQTSDSAERLRPEILACFRGRNVGLPATGNREFVSGSEDALLIIEAFKKKTQKTPLDVLRNCRKRLSIYDRL